jgi:major membrane immunogen (membrane-anchored lipoprotein)
MKKASIILLSSVLLLGLLAGCGSSNKNDVNSAAGNNATTNSSNSANANAEAGTYKDGVYFAKGEVDASSGWQSIMTLTVADGKITDVEWNGISEKAPVDKITYSKDGKYGMKAAGAASEWYEQAEALDKFLIEKQDPSAITLDKEGKTDAVSGVSIHVGEFVDLTKAALAAGPVEVGPYKDGTYHAEGDSFSNGWKDTVDVVVAAGKIVKANFSGVNEAGEDKTQASIDGKYDIKAAGGQAEWHEEAAKAEQYLVDNQDASALKFNDEGKTDAISGVSISVKSFYDLTNKALEQAK